VKKSALGDTDSFKFELVEFVEFDGPSFVKISGFGFGEFVEIDTF